MKRFNFIIGLFICATASAQQTNLSINEAVQIALQNNFGVVIAKNETEIGKINNNWGNAGALPTVSATTSRSFASNNIEQVLANGTEIKRDAASVNNLNANLLVSWRFFDGMRMFATKKRLEELEKMGQINFTRQSNQIVYNTLLAYYDLIRLQQQANAIKEVIALNQERLKIAEMRFNVGTAAKTEVLQAKVDINEQLSQLTAIENTINNGKVTLNTILARDPATAFNLTDTVFQVSAIDYNTLLQKLEAQNPDVQLASSNLAVLQQSKKEINAQRLPTATLSSNYNFARNKSEAGFTLLNQNYGPTAAIGIAIPIFTGGVVKNQLKVADIQIKNQDLTIKELKQQIHSAFNSAFNNYNNGNKLAKMEEANLELIRENNLINMERFKKLSITSVELRQVQLNFTDAQTRRINALYQAKVAEASMKLLCGESGI